MSELQTMRFDLDGPIARITLDRPERGNGITLEMPAELAACVERANLDPSVHVIALAGAGSGFCGGYDLVASAERLEPEGVSAGASRPATSRLRGRRSTPPRSPPTTIPAGPGTRSPTTR